MTAGLAGRLARRRAGWAAVAALAVAVPAASGERLVLAGGGDLPLRAKQRFVEWSGGSSARILVILWSTSEPKKNLKWLREELQPLGPASIEAAPLAPLKPKARALFLAQLGKAHCQTGNLYRACQIHQHVCRACQQGMSLLG